MLSRSTTASLCVAVALAAAATWFVFQNVPPAGGVPKERFLILSEIREFDVLELETDSGILACQRKQGTWWMTHPVSARADDERIHRLLDTLAVAPVRDVITPDEMRIRNISQRDFGIAEPRVRIFLNGPNVPSVELRIGKTAPQGQSLYVGLTGSPQIWVTDPVLLDVLPAGMSDLRDRALLPYATARLGRFELRSPGSPLVAAERDAEGTWWIRQPEPHRASPHAIAALLSHVEDARILSFVHTPDGEKGRELTAEDLGIAYGCTPEEATLVARFWFSRIRSEFEFHEFRVGRPSAENPDQVYLLSTEERLVATVSSTFPNSLRVDLNDLRDHRLWPFDAASVHRVGLQSESGSAVIAREPDGRWTIREPIQAPADAASCDRLVQTLAELTDFATVEDHDPRRYDLRLELTQGSPATVHTALASRVRNAEGATEAFNWVLPPAATLRRVRPEDLPPDLGEPSFLATLREPVLLRIPEPGLADCTYQWGTQTVFQAVSGRDESWTLPENAAEIVPLATLQAIRALTREMPADRVEALAPSSQEPYGLREPLFSVTFRPRDPQQPPRIVALGTSTPGGGRFAGVKGQDSVFVLSREVTDLLEAPLRALGLLGDQRKAAAQP